MTTDFKESLSPCIKYFKTGKTGDIMSVRDTIVKKLQQATCDKTEMNKQVLRWQKSLKEVEKFIGGSKSKEK